MVTYMMCSWEAMELLPGPVAENLVQTSERRSCHSGDHKSQGNPRGWAALAATADGFVHYAATVYILEEILNWSVCLRHGDEGISRQWVLGRRLSIPSFSSLSESEEQAIQAYQKKRS